MRTRIVAATLIAVAVAGALGSYDVARDRLWSVTSEQVADARRSGRPGLEMGERTVTSPELVDDAALLPLRWVFCGFAAGLVALLATGKRSARSHPPRP